MKYRHPTYHEAMQELSDTYKRYIMLMEQLDEDKNNEFLERQIELCIYRLKELSGESLEVVKQMVENYNK